jgi:hypothetical protein
MQARESSWAARSALERLLARQDAAAHDYLADELVRDGDCSSPPSEPEAVPPEESADAVAAG